MKKKDNYKIPDEDTSSVKEPEVGYISNSDKQEGTPLRISEEYLLEHSMTLDESKKLLLEMVHEHFHRS